MDRQKEASIIPIISHHTTKLVTFSFRGRADCERHKTKIHAICDGIILVVTMTRRGRKERVAVRECESQRWVDRFSLSESLTREDAAVQANHNVVGA